MKKENTPSFIVPYKGKKYSPRTSKPSKKNESQRGHLKRREGLLTGWARNIVRNLRFLTNY